MPSISNTNTANGSNSLQQSSAESVLSALAASVSVGSPMSQHHHQNHQSRQFATTSRYSIANPLLAEKLLSPNINDLENLSIGSRTGRPPDIKGKWFQGSNELLAVVLKLKLCLSTVVCE